MGYPLPKFCLCVFFGGASGPSISSQLRAGSRELRHVGCRTDGASLHHYQASHWKFRVNALAFKGLESSLRHRCVL